MGVVFGVCDFDSGVCGYGGWLGRFWFCFCFDGGFFYSVLCNNSEGIYWRIFLKWCVNGGYFFCSCWGNWLDWWYGESF